MFSVAKTDSDDRLCRFVPRGWCSFSTFRSSICWKMAGPGHVHFDVVEGGVRLVNILGQFSDMLVHVQNLETVPDISATSWFISRFTIGPVGEGTSLVDMSVG